MRHFIEVRVYCTARKNSACLRHRQNPAFLEGGSDLPPLDLNLIDVIHRAEKNKGTEREDLAVSVTVDHVSGSSVVEATGRSQSQEPPPEKKRKIVRFADE